MRSCVVTFDTMMNGTDDEPPMERSFDLLTWRVSLADAALTPSGIELAGWAQQLAGAGAADASALLFDVAALHQGFSWQAQANRRSRPTIFGRSPDHAASHADKGTLDRATADLLALARRIHSADFHACPVPPASAARIDLADVAETAHMLRRLLEQAWAPDEQEELAARLAALARAALTLPMIDYRQFAFSPLTVLVPAIATVGLIDFALQTRDLWSGPAGSPALFHHVARLDSYGLGPFLSNVGGLARASRDVFDLARLARDAAVGAGATDTKLERWITLLSRGCRGALLNEIVDDLGDMAAGAALSGILVQVASRRPTVVDLAMVMRLRDAGLDNGDFALAARAQQVIVRLRPDSELEGVILGSIEASDGAFASAGTIFRYWLTRSPDNEDLRARLAATEAERFDRFFISSGFSSPADRRDTRLRRRGLAAEYPRRRGERLRAVDPG